MQPMLAHPGDGRRPVGWWAHQKLDGHRCAVTITDRRVTGWSRKGTQMDLPLAVDDELHRIANIVGRLTIDGELMPDGTLWLFDLVEYSERGVTVTAHTPLAERLRRLDELFGSWRGPAVRLLPVARTPDEVEDLIARVKAAGGEGVVHKNPASSYVEGKRVRRSWVKEKNTRDVDCVVYGFGIDGSDNIGLAMIDLAKASAHNVDLAGFPDEWDGLDAFLDVLLDAGVLAKIGEVSRLTGHGPSVQRGQVVTVTILYTTAPSAEHPHGRLYQPVTARIRHDKPARDCTTDQLDEHRVNRAVIPFPTRSSA